MKTSVESITFRNGQKVFLHPGGGPMVGKMNLRGDRLFIDGQEDKNRTIDKEAFKSMTGRD